MALQVPIHSISQGVHAIWTRWQVRPEYTRRILDLNVYHPVLPGPKQWNLKSGDRRFTMRNSATNQNYELKPKIRQPVIYRLEFQQRTKLRMAKNAVDPHLSSKYDLGVRANEVK